MTERKRWIARRTADGSEGSSIQVRPSEPCVGTVTIRNLDRWVPDQIVGGYASSFAAPLPMSGAGDKLEAAFEAPADVTAEWPAGWEVAEDDSPRDTGEGA